MMLLKSSISKSDRRTSCSTGNVKTLVSALQVPQPNQTNSNLNKWW